MPHGASRHTGPLRLPADQFLSPGFDQKLGLAEQRLHLLALGLVAVAVALVMTPAAYHRQTGGREITERFVAVSTRLLLYSMLPLAVGIAVDFALIVGVVFDRAAAWCSARNRRRVARRALGPDHETC